MDAARVVSRRVIKAVPMTEERRQHLAKRRPIIDSAKFFEFKSTLAYGPEDHEDVKRVTVQPRERSSAIQPQSVQPDSKPPAEIVQPVQASSPGPTSVSSASPRIPVSPMPHRASPNPATSPMSPVNPRRVSFGPAPASPAPDQPVAASPAPVHKPPTPVKEYGRSKRGQIPNRQIGQLSISQQGLLRGLRPPDHGRCKVTPHQQSCQRPRSRQESVCHDGSSR
jgi:hypothetical protein